MSESVVPVSGAAGRPGVWGVVVPAVVAVAISVPLSAWGTFGDHFHSESLGEYAIVLTVTAVAVAVVFGWLVPRGLRRESAGWTAIALSVLGFLTIAIFWSGVTPVLAMGGITLGWAGRSARRGRFLCRGAIAVGIVAIVGDLVVYVQDMAA
jgi:hypothetical protein